MRRTGVALATAALLLGTVTACGGGGGSDAPDNASKDDFCQAFNGLFEKVMAQATSGDPSTMIKALKDWAADIEKVGTPSDMPDDARHGFELFVDEAKKIEDDATLEDLQNLGEDLSSEDQADGEAFSTWTTENCPMELPSLNPSDLPSEMPTDLPTDPSDLESMLSELSQLTESAG
jgi:hypothetical protein